jgi:hypothetical protein
MSQISAQVRLRPIRFGFLVRPDAMQQALKVFHVNTCLWGGKYNPVIPYIKQVPKWWDRHGHRFETAEQIVNGYLDFFEPDFLVETEKGMSQELGYEPDRVVQLSDLLRREGDRHFDGPGLNVFELYSDLYREEFQFTRRHEHNIVHVPTYSRGLAGFVASVFGAFPPEPDLSYISRAFSDAFAPREVSLDAPTLVELYKSGFTSALRLGHSKIDVGYHDRQYPALFVLDISQPRDLIDYWNLRAVRSHIVPIPKHWLPELSSFCRNFITDNHRPLPDNPHGVMIDTTVMFSRSIPSDQIEKLHRDHFVVDPPVANIRQDWYPSIWRPSRGITIREMRPTLSAKEAAFDCSFTEDTPRIRFDSLYPEFADEGGHGNRWANVIRLRDWSNEKTIATTFPTNYRNPQLPQFELGGDSILSTTEGFVSFPAYTKRPQYWRVIDGLTAHSEWLKAIGVDATISDAGRSTAQIIKAVGSFGLRCLANPQIIEMLNKLSRQAVSPSGHYMKIKNQIRNATKDDIWGGRSFETLVEKNVLELGLELKCTKCSSWNWYTLKQLDYQMRCTLCLQPFAFPILDPGASDHSRWAYRLIGPFVLPGYAAGGYSSALSIRFFSDVLGRFDQSVVTWAAGQILELPSAGKVEADFILWYQRKQMFGTDYPTDLVFGEAKSFGKDSFKAEDIERMKRFSLHFPGSVMVFATMKNANDLSAGERKRISQFALWGREYLSDRRGTRAPVILLTGVELFARHSLHDAWEKIGGLHEQFSKAGWMRAENLRVLADMTQQLYLGLPSYHSWLDVRWKKKLARRRDLPAKQNSQP